MRVGFIGLGSMGSGIAANLVAAGHEVTVYNRTPGKMQPLVERGAGAASSVADACRGEVVITILADNYAVESVTFGQGGIVESLARGAIHLSMGTISVALFKTPDRGPHGSRTAFCRSAGSGAPGCGRGR